MYRCYLTRAGHIAMGENWDMETLDEAIAKSHKLLAAQPRAENFDGIEIWQGRSFLYAA